MISGVKLLFFKHEACFFKKINVELRGHIMEKENLTENLMMLGNPYIVKLKKNCFASMLKSELGNSHGSKLL